MAPAFRAAREGEAILIRKMRSSGKSHVFAFLQDVVVNAPAMGVPSGPFAKNLAFGYPMELYSEKV